MLRILCTVATLLASAAVATAQTWPTKPVRIIVPYSAGGGTDIVARVLAERLTENLSQRFVVENKAGASGMIGAEAVAKSAPDGYTLLIGTPAEMVINNYIFRQLTYDPQRDFTPITLLATTPIIIVAHPNAGISSPQDLLVLLTARSRALSYSSPGVGTAQHLAGEFLKLAAGVDMQHVPYKGAAPAVQDTVSGQVPLSIAGMPPVIAHIKSGTSKAVTVTSSKRSALLPDVIALPELGEKYKDLDINNWFGLLAPAAVPKDIVTKLHVAATKAFDEPIVRERISQQAAEPVGGTPEAFKAFMLAEAAKYARIVSATGVKADP